MKEKPTYQVFMPSGCLTSDSLIRLVKKELRQEDQLRADEHLENCAFCRDAFEGIKLMKDPGHLKEELAFLEKQISQHQKDEKKKTKRNDFVAISLGIAASIALLSGVGFLLYTWLQVPEQIPLATRNIPLEIHSVPPMPRGNIVSTSPIENANKLHTDSKKHLDPESHKNKPTENQWIQKPIAPAKSKTIHAFYAENEKESTDVMDKPNMDIASTQPIEVYYPGIGISASDEGFNQELLMEKNSESNSPEPEKPSAHFFASYDKMASFKGGEQMFRLWLSGHLEYPKDAIREKIEGTVYVSFIIEADGSISNVELRRGIGGGCNREALRVISEMPAWNPALNHGQAVRVLIFMPIRFLLLN